MRKILAVLLAVLMLCTVIPMGALSVAADPGDVALDQNFDDGNAHFERGYVEDGYLVFDATTADWQNCYQYVNGIKANTIYTVTFKAMANKDASLALKINNNWAGDTVKESVAVTTEWQDYELTINSGDLTGTAILMFASDYPAGSAPIYCIDDLKIVEAVDPALIGKVINGDFETGDNTGWNIHQSTTIGAEAALSGSYGAHLVGNGGWGGMLDQTIIAIPGASYEITLSFKVVANGVNIQIKSAAGTQLAGGWYDVNKAGEWTTQTFLVTAEDDGILINFCGAGNGTSEEVYVDNVSALQLIDPSFDGYIYNGDFETGKTDSWDPVWWAQNISIVEGRNGGSAMQFNGGQWQLVRQKVDLLPNTNYVVSVYAKDASNVTLLIKDGNDSANIKQAGITAGSDWTKVSVEFNSGEWNQVYVAVMGNTDGASVVVDDFFMFEKPEASNDGYIVNGTFETGDLQPWNNLWGSCPKAEVVQGGMDSNWALEIVSGQWKHVRQTNIAVEANTDYKISAWVKNAKGMSLLVKDGGDSVDIVNQGIEAGEEWTEFTIEFNTGDYTSIIFSLMGNNAEEAYGTFDNIVMEKTSGSCEHEYEYECDKICSICGEESNPDAGHAYFYACDKYCMYCGEKTNAGADHNVLHVAAKDPVSCIEFGNKEYWYCSDCGSAWLDEDMYRLTNLKSVMIAGECISNAPACKDGECINCGLPYGAEAEHTYDDEYDADCNLCGDIREVPEKPVEVIYGDANGDGSVNNLDVALLQRFLNNWEVTVDEASADANGDGSVNNLDVALLQRFLNNWEVTLGPV